jgi:DNA transposition AAA+ family ATPase
MSTTLITPPDLTDQQLEIIDWWETHQVREQLSASHVARLAGISTSTYSRVLSGKYEGSVAAICDKLIVARDNIEAHVANPDFFASSLANQMWDLFGKSRQLRTIIFMWGVKGIGKTTCAREFTSRKNKGATIYHRSGPALTFNQWVKSLALALRINPLKLRDLALREKIISTIISRQQLLILDEFHQIFIREHRSNIHAVLICEFIREIFDRTETGICPIGTKAMLTEFLSGDHAPALEQLMDRAEDPVELPPKPTKSDLANCIKHYGLDHTFSNAPEAAQIVSDIFAAHGLRKLVIRLRGAAAWASERSIPFSWDSFTSFTRHLETNTAPPKTKR